MAPIYYSWNARPAAVLLLLCAFAVLAVAASAEGASQLKSVDESAAHRVVVNRRLMQTADSVPKMTTEDKPEVDETIDGSYVAVVEDGNKVEHFLGLVGEKLGHGPDGDGVKKHHWNDKKKDAKDEAASTGPVTCTRGTAEDCVEDEKEVKPWEHGYFDIAENWFKQDDKKNDHLDGGHPISGGHDSSGDCWEIAFAHCAHKKLAYMPCFVYTFWECVLDD